MYNFKVVSKIKNDSLLVDSHFIDASAGEFEHYKLLLPVPSHHPRAKVINATRFSVEPIASIDFPEESFYLVDEALRGLLAEHSFGGNILFVEAKENTLKELSWLEVCIRDNPISASTNTLVGIGGGILLNAAAYIAEKMNIDFISVPTTILAAADSAIGGLVRMNKVEGKNYIKSFYKSVYEPSKIILDRSIIVSLPENQICWGLSEVVKHGVYQSAPLLEYLASDDFRPLENESSLIKAVCWTVALKNVAIIHDPDSKGEGGSILRGGHVLALRIEEESNFTISHGQAVAVGVYQDNKDNDILVALLDRIYKKLSLPKAQSDLG